MSQGLSSIILMVVLIGMIYFMMIRPQKKKEKADREMRESLRIGDEVITIGGVVGKIEKITDKTVVISTTSARNKIEFLKTAIASSTSADSGAKQSGGQEESKEKVEEEINRTSRDKKVTPKKLTRKGSSSEESAE